MIYRLYKEIIRMLYNWSFGADEEQEYLDGLYTLEGRERFKKTLENIKTNYQEKEIKRVVKTVIDTYEKAIDEVLVAPIIRE